MRVFLHNVYSRYNFWIGYKRVVLKRVENFIWYTVIRYDMVEAAFIDVIVIYKNDEDKIFWKESMN